MSHNTLAGISISGLQSLAWSMADTIEDPKSDPYAVECARWLETQIHAEISRVQQRQQQEVAA